MLKQVIILLDRLVSSEMQADIDDDDELSLDFASISSQCTNFRLDQSERRVLNWIRNHQNLEKIARSGAFW